MVKTQEFTDKIYWRWNKEFDFVKRGDVEYWLPKYNWIDKGVNNIETRNLQELCITSITKGETPIWRGDAYVKQGVPFIRSEQLKSFFLDLSLNPVFIPIKAHNIMARSKILKGDILLAIVGATTGQCALINNIDEANCNQAVAIIRPKKMINRNYLTTAINSAATQSQIQRIGSGGARVNIDLNEVRGLKIPVPKDKFQEYIDKLVDSAFKLRQQADQEYKQAQQILENKLELDKVNLQDQAAFWRWSDEIDVFKRLDPNYYQEKNCVIQRLLNGKLYTVNILKELTTGIQKGIEVGHTEYRDSGIPFLRVANISERGIDLSNCNYIRPLLFEELKKNFKVNEGDVLFSKDGTIGISLVFEENFDCVTSSGILRMRIDENKIDKYYLTLLLNSTIAKLQILKDTSGAIIQHFNIDKVKELKIPLLPSPIQDKISSLVRSSLKKHKQSKEQLEKAKKYIEDLIEGKIK